jgi:hypothetical protein
MIHDGITHSPRAKTVARTARSNHAQEQRGTPATGPSRRSDGRAGQRPRPAAAKRRWRARWSVRDRISAAVAGTGAGTVLAITVLAVAGAPGAAYAALGAIGAGATAATPVRAVDTRLVVGVVWMTGPLHRLGDSGDRLVAGGRIAVARLPCTCICSCIQSCNG